MLEMKIFFRFIFILFITQLSSAQMFIPFGFLGPKAALSVTPTVTQYIQPGELISFTASGSTGSYTWSVSVLGSGDGSTITTPGATADYTGRTTAYTTDTVTVTSATSLNVNVITYTPLVVAPASLTMPVSTTFDFGVTNGLCVLSPPTACTDATVTWSIVSGAASGSVNSVGLLTATAFPGTVVLQALDALGNISTATVIVTNTLQISPTTLRLGLFSTNIFTAILGTQPYSYSVFTGTGTIGCQSTLTGTHTNLVTTINVTSTSGCPSVGVVKVGTEDICYTSTTATTFAGATRGCNATTAASYSAGQTYNASQAVYTAPSLIGSATVRVTDVGLTNSNSNVSIIRPVDVKVGQYFACVKYDEGSLKCWGTNGSGQLGIGSTTTIGDSSLEVGGANGFVNLGTSRTVSKFTLGATHACAILDNNQTKCWGAGGSGRLLSGGTASLGNTLGTTGDGLVAINLGTGRTAVEISAGGTHTCAILDNGTVKCWGSGASGRLGNNSTASLGDSPTETGDGLPIVDLGAGRTAIKIVTGLDFTCVILDNGTVKCWGESQRGQTGQDTTVDVGDAAGEMAALSAVNIGAGRTAIDIIAAYESVCIMRDNLTMICWGQNSNGQLGIGSTAGNNVRIGDQVGEMAAIAAINMNAGFGTLSRILATGRSPCAMDASNVVKCWGYNAFGQLLRGNTANVSSPGVTTTNYGTGLVVSKVETYLDTICVLFTNDRIKCFGRARTGTVGVVNGVLLNGSVENSIGDAAAEVGDSVLFTNH